MRSRLVLDPDVTRHRAFLAGAVATITGAAGGATQVGGLWAGVAAAGVTTVASVMAHARQFAFVPEVDQ